MGIERGLHLLAADILAAADDDVLLAVDDDKIAVLVEISDIAGADVAVGGEEDLGRLRIAPVAAYISGAADVDLAVFAGWHMNMLLPAASHLSTGGLPPP